MLTALVLLTLVLLFIWYWRKSYSFWKDQNVPQLPTWPILGSYIPGKKPLQELEQELYKKYGRVYGRYDGSLEVLSVGEPHLLKHILIKDFHLFPNRRDVRFNDDVFDNTLFALEGDNWKRVRSIVTRNLTTAKLKRMLPLMDDCCDILIDTILSTTKSNNEEINLQRVFSTFTIDVIGRCAFGISIGSLGSEDDPFVEKAKRLLDCKLGFRTVLTMLCPSVMKSLRISLLNPETTSFYRNVILDVMEERKKNKKVRDDFLQLLLDVQNDIQDQNNNNVPDTIGEKQPKSEIFTVADETAHDTSGADNKNLAEKGLSLDELVAQCVTFFMAGYDATTSLLTNALYHLATNSRHQERVLQEMKEAVRKQGGVVNYETLSELKYLDAVLNECLRLCPSMVRNERRVENDYTLPETHIRLKRGMIISIPVYAMHRDPEWYPEPELFRPDRFLDTDSSRPSLVHIPFGAGPRVCVGFRFVMMQVKLCLTRILLRFQATPGTTTPKHLSLTEIRNVLKINDVDILLKKRTD